MVMQGFSHFCQGMFGSLVTGVLVVPMIGLTMNGLTCLLEDRIQWITVGCTQPRSIPKFSSLVYEGPIIGDLMKRIF